MLHSSFGDQYSNFLLLCFRISLNLKLELERKQKMELSHWKEKGDGDGGATGARMNVNKGRDLWSMRNLKDTKILFHGRILGLFLPRKGAHSVSDVTFCRLDSLKVSYKLRFLLFLLCSHHSVIRNFHNFRLGWLSF